MTGASDVNIIIGAATGWYGMLPPGQTSELIKTYLPKKTHTIIHYGH